MKRKLLKSLFAMLLVCSIFTFSAFNLNAAYVDALAEQGITISQTKYVKTITDNKSINRIMNESSFQSLTKSLDKQELSDYEKNVQILKELGFEDITIEGMAYDEVANMFENALSVTTQTQYLKSNADGTSTIISADECYDAVKSLQTNSGIATLSNDVKDSTTSEDGYMKITISCVYIDPATLDNEKGWYMIYTWFEWCTGPQGDLDLPDAISISAPYMSWSNSSDTGSYYSSMYYKGIGVYGTTVTSSPVVKTTEDLSIEANGVFYTWLMPYNQAGLTITYTQLYMHAKARVLSPSISWSPNVYARYVNTKHRLVFGSPTFEWTIGSFPGVSLSVDSLITSTDYTCRVIIDYDP